MKKVISIVSLIVVTAIVAGGGVWYWQKSVWNKEKIFLTKERDALQKQKNEAININNDIINQETNEAKNKNVSQQSSKTYINEKYGYQLNYPPNVGLFVPGLVSPFADDQSNAISFNDADKGEAEFLSLYILDNKNLSLDKIVDLVAKNYSKKESITINDLQAIRVSFTEGTINTIPYASEASSFSALAENQEFVFISPPSVNSHFIMFDIRDTQDKGLANQIVNSFKAIK